MLDFDYRGSAGFGRDYRTDIAYAMGQKDVDGVVAAARWLVQTQGIDSTRIGIYGVSYGGFMTLMSQFRYPGLVDDNVHFQDTARLVQRLLELEKDFEVMYYPMEPHVIETETALRPVEAGGGVLRAMVVAAERRRLAVEGQGGPESPGASSFRVRSAAPVLRFLRVAQALSF